jgi:hypothetical protein
VSGSWSGWAGEANSGKGSGVAALVIADEGCRATYKLNLKSTVIMMTPRSRGSRKRYNVARVHSDNSITSGNRERGIESARVFRHAGDKETYRSYTVANRTIGIGLFLSATR